MGETCVLREISQNDILQCVTVIRESFATVAKEFNITKDNAPRFTAFATDEQDLYIQEQKNMIFFRLPVVT